MSDASGGDGGVAGPSTVIMVPNPKGLAARLLRYVEDEEAHPLPEDVDREGGDRGEASTSALSAALGGRTASYMMGDRSDMDGGMASSFYTETTSRMQPIDLSAFFGRSAIEVGDPSRYNPEAGDAAGSGMHAPLESNHSGSLLGLPLPGAVTNGSAAVHTGDAMNGTDVTAAPFESSAAAGAQSATGDGSTSARREGSRRPASSSNKRTFDILALNGRWEDAFAEKQARASEAAAAPAQEAANTSVEAVPTGVPEQAASQEAVAVGATVSPAKDAATRSPAATPRGVTTAAEVDTVKKHADHSVMTDRSAAVTLHSGRSDSMTLTAHPSSSLSPDVGTASPMDPPSFSHGLGKEAALTLPSGAAVTSPPLAGAALTRDAAQSTSVASQSGANVRTPVAIVDEVPSSSVGCFCGGSGAGSKKAAQRYNA